MSVFIFLLLYVFCFLRFFAVCWVENEDVAKQAIEVWKNVKAVMKSYKQQASSQQSRKNSSYDPLLLHVQSKFVLVRLHFFHDIAMILNKFLVASHFYAFLSWESLFSLNVAWWMYYIFFSTR